MAEQIINLQNINPIHFYGPNDINLTTFAGVYPKIKLLARGNIIKATGSDEDLVEPIDKLNKIIEHIQKYGSLSEKGFNNIINLQQHLEHEAQINDSAVLLHTPNGNIIKARTPNQLKMVEAIAKNDMLFAIGPAGSGKTYTAIALAVKAIKNKEVKKIILTRPAVEAGENLGFLPGDLKEKLDPYLLPLFDALRDMIAPDKLKQYMEHEIIQIAPLAFMRGRTLENAFVILDEAQNATSSQMKMFLTRMGRNTKFAITGDITQIDLPKHQTSGLVHVHRLLQNIEGIAWVELTDEDIVRHPIVKRIIKRYDEEQKN